MKKWCVQLCSLGFLLASFTANASAELKVYAASSLTNAIDQIADDFSHQHGVKVTTVYGGSSSIARQIINGAPADVFISANTKWMKYLVNAGLLRNDGVTNVTQNSLVVIAPSFMLPRNFELYHGQAWVEALQEQRLALGEPMSVPAGMYAKQALQHIGVWPDVQRQIAPAKNVRQALTFVERGETRLGIVYKTDARLSDKVTVVAELPVDAHSKIVYPAAVINDSPLANQFVDYLHSAKAKSVFTRFGFRE
ncbi:molybdate ABC transporter substrate-binding protein [Vibrio sp. CAU 1672]|uniref:molybdate ABC transporter substrate-binding protein n=1 Tax=Vibrio sp. CAU 1672 TaxID=3032594 RepID=UPI0023DAF3E8|nr:molybdate ABC transporter substrate-binding protein [Vibrio sp. CAU 1672]MDF2154493.1 molybdate ABC transporter substrate-binding protein [Vibrio sp. CAU 1672]